MNIVTSELITEPYDVDRRLSEMELTRDGLVRARDIALGAAAEATAYHPSFAPGMKSYMEGVFAIRSEFIRAETQWRFEKHNGMDFIRNDSLKIRVGFSNVLDMPQPSIGPKARSPRGPGAERACQGNLSFDFGPEFELETQCDTSVATYFFMVSRNGCAELSRPIIQGGNFKDYIERLSISDGSDFDLNPAPFEDDGDLDVFDPVVSRK
ncbi:hypothetical protein GY26_16010 [Gammaproteobacteria bacterium MFB021]|nr:hypothetical protein GY26_16010 [Gammaproteobacteria bacterium MFB021]